MVDDGAGGRLALAFVVVAVAKKDPIIGLLSVPSGKRSGLGGPSNDTSSLSSL